MYKIEENEEGYFTIYEFKTVSSFFNRVKTIKTKMYINHLGNGKWYINGVFTSETECMEYLDLFKAQNNRELVNKFIN